MPRYYFNLYDDVEARDEEGLEMADRATARAYAVHLARFTAAETIKESGRYVPDHRIAIVDEHGKVLDTIYFRDAVEVEAARPPTEEK